MDATAVLHCPRAPAMALAGPAERRNPSWREAFLQGLLTWERLERWPTRLITGYHIALRAEKPELR